MNFSAKGKKTLSTSLIALVVVFATSSVLAAPMSVSFDDPTGDFVNFNVDLTGMTLDFDNSTGDYQLTVTFDAANPLVGTFNVNANLLNGSIAPLTTDPAFVGINERPTIAAPTTELIINGTDARLMSWNAGDVIASDSSVFGIPIDASFTDFVSGVQDFGLAVDLLGDPSSSVSVVPEPSTLALLGAGLLGLAALRQLAAQQPGSR